MFRLKGKAMLATALVPLLAMPGVAQDYGNFDGYTLLKIDDEHGLFFFCTNAFQNHFYFFF